MSGDVAWGRLSLRRTDDDGRPLLTATSATPVTLARRADLPWLMAGLRNGAGPVAPDRGAGHQVLELLRSQGALFYDDLVAGIRRLPTDVERGLWDLVARGLATADGFQALRALMSPRKSGRRNGNGANGKLGRSYSAGVPAGRWALLPAMNSESKGEELAEWWAAQLLFRYGVVFRDAVRREGLTVPWRDVLRALRRMEARGEIRGGRFVAGFYGEQYARPEAVESLRRVRRADKNDELVHVTAVDPLNLAGILTPGPRVTAVHTNLVTYKDGVPVAEATA
jgi:ATP-dependent Lhr-like helicase